MKYAKWLEESLRLSKRSQADLARQLGWSEAVVSRCVRGSRPLRAEEVDKIAAFLGVESPSDKATKSRLRTNEPSLLAFEAGGGVAFLRKLAADEPKTFIALLARVVSP